MRIILFIAICLVSLNSAGSLIATFDLKHFLVPGEKPYVETHILIDGGTTKYAEKDSGLYMSTIQTTIVIYRGEDVVDFRKINVMSPLIQPNEIADIIDIQRFVLDPGSYRIELQLTDVNADDQPLELLQDFELSLNASTVGISDITFLSGYSKATTPTELTKSGYNLLPYIADHFPSDANKLVFYAEAYNSHLIPDASGYLLTYYIENADGPITETQRYFREKPKPVRPLLESIDITLLKEGSYVLKIEIRDRNNSVLAENGVLFYRSTNHQNTQGVMLVNDAISPYYLEFANADSINDYLLSLYPIATGVEFNTIQNLVSSGDMEAKKNYFYYFWEMYYPEAPMQGWQKYASEVAYVKRKYSTPVLPGYLTDRGRIYLKYGKPNTMVVRHNETEVYPYEIWHYYKIGQFNNKRFLFYSRSVATIDFELLHSDMYGELQNEDWPVIMRSKFSDIRPTDSNLNRSNPQDTFSGDELEDLFYNPR
ncbi:MAG: hypothetical protein RL226_584 [Bacteroidota bacterium]